MLASARCARTFASLPSSASARAWDAQSSMSSMFRRIDHIAERIDDWKARYASASARSWSSSGPSSASEQRRPHPLAVVAERLRLPDGSPQERPVVRVVAQLGGTRVQLDRLLHLVASVGEVACPPQPVDGPRPQPGERGGVVAPHEVDVLGPHGLAVVVREDRRLDRGPIAVVEPLREGRVEPAATCLRDAPVRDVTGERVLERVLGLTVDGRTASPADEVATLEQRVVGIGALEEPGDGTGPEHATHDRRRLQSRLLGLGKPIDAGGEGGMDGVGDGEPGRERGERPGPVAPLEHAVVDERADELLDEERVALGPRDESRPQLVRQLDGEQLVEHAQGRLLGERLQPDRRRVAACSPARAP